jgi:multiple sugar transport system permease protein
MLPTVTTYKQLDVFGILGLVNSLTGIDIRPDILGGALTFYLPALFGVGIRAGIIIYIYIQFFKGLPKELEEAAWIDGAGPLKTYLRIALPSSGVVITTVSVFSIIWHWNDSYLASIYLDQSNWPLAVKLSEITNYEGLGAMAGIKFGPENPESVAIVMAACLLFVLPVLIMYMILQNKFVKSIDRVGITG